MKVATLLFLASLSCVRLHAGLSVLDTPSFRIEIEHACEEGCVSCDRIQYRGTSKKAQRSIALIGSTVHTFGADGQTPARFLGYRFVSGSTIYFVGEDGQIEVAQRAKVLVSELGVWNHDPKKPNKALEPTTTSVTSPAYAGAAPAAVVAHL